VKLGLILPLFSGDVSKVLGAAREAEDLGFDGVFVFDHLFPPGAPPDRPALEAFATLAAVAAATDRVTQGTVVTRASRRPIGLLAKTAAWIDRASGGRLVLGIGTGDPIDRPEHEAYGLPMLDKTDRRAHLQEAVHALKALFGGSPYPGGRLVPPLDGPLEPRPSDPSGPPIWIGAQAEEVVRIAGRLADGWNGWGLDAPAFASRARVLAEAAGEAGRAVEATWAGIALVGADGDELAELQERRRSRGFTDEAWAGTPDDLVGFLESLRASGASWAVLVAAGPPDRRRLLAERVLPSLRSPVGD
jgi:alkanesulfonate monooxygenase SsuD/methylene tetrahydromethanopterin reductase-like flavin-dependent oxidoreductase (luciferase family)